MTNWSRVYYTNAIALVPLLVALPLSGEHLKLAEVQWTPNVLAPLVLLGLSSGNCCLLHWPRGPV